MFRNCKWQIGKLNSAFHEFVYFRTGQLRSLNKKIPKLRNNFMFQNEFKEFKSSEAQVKPKNKVPSPYQRKILSESMQSKIMKKKFLTPLQYKGEILFGIHPVYLALYKKKRNIYQLFLKTNEEIGDDHKNFSRKKKIETLAKANGISICNVDSKGMKYLAPGAVHQGVCLDASSLPLPEWQENERECEDLKLPVWLVLDKILDPMNVGAIIRSAHYFGVNKLFVVRGNSCKLSPTVSKASSGALEVVDIHQIENIQEFIQVQKNFGWNIMSTVAYCEDQNENFRPVVDIADVKIIKPTILILGSEGKGISSEIQTLCDSFISIYPKQELHHGIDSLNVSVATGVILYVLSSQRQKYINNL